MTTIPKFLSHLPVDKKHGWPIPFVQYIVPETGEPDFRITDGEKTVAAVQDGLCGLCGKPIVTVPWFIGGPGSMITGAFTDPPMHIYCAQYALVTCPHLANPKKPYANRAKPEDVTTMDIVDTARRGEFIGAAYKSDIELTVVDGGLVIRAPIYLCQEWSEGKSITDMLSIEDMEQKLRSEGRWP